MVTFRNNNNGRRNNFRRNDRNFKAGTERGKFVTNYSNSDNFQRKIPGRNNHNASKLIEKYNNLAREALSGGDKILSENYFQHAVHFTRILNEKEDFRKIKNSKDDLNQAQSNSGQKKIETDSDNEKSSPEKILTEAN